jgi:MFS family permease
MVTASGISVAYLCVAGVAQRAGSPGAAGYVEAAIGLGSVVGGLLWARRDHTRPWSAHLGGLIAVLAVGLLAASFATNLVVLGVVMAAAGVAVAPLFVVSYLAADTVTPPYQRTEASTWINTANNLGSSAGAALAGVAIDRTTPSHGFLAGGVLLALVAATVWLSGVRQARDGGGRSTDDRDRALGEHIADEAVVAEDLGLDATGAVPAVVADPVDDVAPAGRGERATEVLHGQARTQVAEGKTVGQRPAAEGAEDQ